MQILISSQEALATLIHIVRFALAGVQISFQRSEQITKSCTTEQRINDCGRTMDLRTDWMTYERRRGV